MTSAGSPERAPWFRRRRWGCLALGVALVIPVVFIGYLILLSFSFRECNPPQTLSGTSADSTITLDAGHPIVEQQMTVHVPAAGLPDQRRADAATLDLEPAAPRPGAASARPRSTHAPSAAPSPGAPASGILVAFVRADTGEVVARISASAGALDADLRPTLATIDLDCEVARDCDRTYRIVVSIPAGRSDPADSITWTARATIVWGYDTCAGPPYTAQPKVTLGPPVAAGPDRLVTAGLPLRSESGTILARHVTVSSDGAPDVAYGHLFVRRSQAAWVPWLRIVPDGGGAPIVDAPIGGVYAGREDQLVDFPILAGCTRGSPCRRGYWIVVQALPLAGFDNVLAWHPGPDVGSLDWQLAAIGAAVAGEQPAAPIALAIDGEPPDLGPAPVLETDQVRIDIAPDVERYVEVALHVPAVSEAAGGPDPRHAAYVAVNVGGHGVVHGYHLEGDGPGPFVGGAKGDSYTSLIAHPFDGCPTSGPCDVVVRVVAGLTPDPDMSVSGAPQVTFRLAVLGAPAGTTATVGPVQERPRTDAAGNRTDVPVLQLVLGGAAATVVVLFLIRRAGRRSRGRRRPA